MGSQSEAADVESDDPIFDLADDEELYQEFRDMNRFEMKCAGVVIATLLFAVICLFIGVSQVDYYMASGGAFQESMDEMKSLMRTVKDGLSLTNIAVTDLTFVGSELKAYLKYA